MNALPHSLSKLLLPTGASEASRVETTTLLPGGSLATLSVTRVGDAFTVSDEGAGRSALLALGLPDFTSGDARRGNEIAEAGGLAFDNGQFELRNVSPDQVPAAIVYVADATRSWAASAVEARARRTANIMVDRAVDRLRSVLPGLQLDLDRELSGASSKRHRFEIVATLPEERYAVFETVLPVPTSLASVHLKFFDLAQAAGSWPREAIVDDLGSWPAADVAVLQQVSTHVRGFDSSWSDLRDLAA